MTAFKIIKLINLSPTHIGTGKGSYDFSHDELKSDTISSALASIRAQYGKADDLEQFLNSFTISSAFPFWKDTLFLPKACGRINIDVIGESPNNIRKDLKRVKYVESSIWSKLVRSEDVKINKSQLHNSFIIKDREFEDLYISQVGQRVFVPREGDSDTEPFYFEWNFFHPDGGLYCIVDCDDKTFNEVFELFKMLGVVGIGTDKSVGGGKFEVEVGNITIPIINDYTHKMLLSTYIPTEEEHKNIVLEESKYNLISRGGFIAGSSNMEMRHLRKKSIFMFDSSSILKVEEPLYGKIVNLRPEWNNYNLHPVYRSGKPFYIPIKIINYE